VDVEAKLALFSPCPERFEEKSLRGPRFEIRVDNGRFGELEISDRPLLRREMLCSYPHPHREVSRYLAGIPGEFPDSKLDLGLDARANLAPVKNDFLGSIGTRHQIRKQG
jgi:hypothetical protein